MSVGKKGTPGNHNDLQAVLMETGKITPQIAPEFVQRAMLELYQGHDIRALSMARKAERKMQEVIVRQIGLHWRARGRLAEAKLILVDAHQCCPPANCCNAYTIPPKPHGQSG